MAHVSNSYLENGNAYIVIHASGDITSTQVQWTTYKPTPATYVIDDNDAISEVADTTNGTSTGVINGNSIEFTVPDVSLRVTAHFEYNVNGEPTTGTIVHEFPEVEADIIEDAYDWTPSAWDEDWNNEQPYELRSALDTVYILEYVPDPGLYLFTTRGFPTQYEQLILRGTLVLDGRAVGHALGRRLRYCDITIDSVQRRHALTTYAIYQIILLEDLPATDRIELRFMLDGATFSKRMQFDGNEFYGPNHFGIDSVRFENHWLGQAM